MPKSCELAVAKFWLLVYHLPSLDGGHAYRKICHSRYLGGVNSIPGYRSLAGFKGNVELVPIRNGRYSGITGGTSRLAADGRFSMGRSSGNGGDTLVIYVKANAIQAVVASHALAKDAVAEWVQPGKVARGHCR